MSDAEHSHNIEFLAATHIGRLFEVLWVFHQEYQYCGELDGGVKGDRVWMTRCPCGGSGSRSFSF